MDGTRIDRGVAVKWPNGIASAGIACGIKADGSPDLGLVAADAPAAWAGTFTKNAAAAAPVLWSRSLLGRSVRGIVCNSGNANACTGADGEKAVRLTAEAAARELGCSPDEVLVASTGPIGVTLPLERVLMGIGQLPAGLSPDVGAFAGSILTTDSASKVASAPVGDATVVGVAKGAAMCAPNMATMLAFIATDAEVDGSSLQGSLSQAVEGSFNRISIDGCESTNDSVFLMATGVAGRVDEAGFAAALETVCDSLAEQIVRDAEGGRRLLRIVIQGATDDGRAVALGRAVADSVLWRCAVHGADPNWGRILSALGSTQRDLVLGDVSVTIGSEPVFDRGEPVADLTAAAAAMDADEVTVICKVGSGDGSSEILSADTSPEYVLLNAEGTS